MRQGTVSEMHPLFDVDELVKNIDAYWDYHLHSRALNPHMAHDLVGCLVFRPGGYYINKGYDYVVKFDEPVTEERIVVLNEAGYWANQNFIIRLYSLLEGYKIVGSEKHPWGSIIKGLVGSEELDILRRLRNEFAHSVGFYDDSQKKHRKLHRRIISHFRLNRGTWSSSTKMFPIPIDQVLEPITDGCKQYVGALYEHRTNLTKQMQEE